MFMREQHWALSEHLMPRNCHSHGLRWCQPSTAGSTFSFCTCSSFQQTSACALPSHCCKMQGNKQGFQAHEGMDTTQALINTEQDNTIGTMISGVQCLAFQTELRPHHHDRGTKETERQQGQRGSAKVKEWEIDAVL